jgi:Ca2+-binding RTX toxin-like protein
VVDDHAKMIFARKGSDTVSAQGANDLMCGGNGNDRLTGGLGADRFGGGSGTDTATTSTPPRETPRPASPKEGATRRRTHR